MAKAILVMDMPESCFGCNFLYCNADAGIDSCQAMEVPRIVDSETYEKPDWCPLLELPEKIPDFEHGYENVEKSIIRICWNACLDKILERKE